MKNLSEKRVGLGVYHFFFDDDDVCCLFRLFVCLFVFLASFSFEPHFSEIFMKTYCKFYFKV